MDDEIPNHSPYSDDDYITLKDCFVPKIAWGNCDAVSEHLCEQIEGAQLIKTTYFKYLPHVNQHVAVLLDNGNVLDYTARQFSDKLKFPMISQSIDEWKTTFANIK